jgi:hypothetical protein
VGGHGAAGVRRDPLAPADDRGDGGAGIRPQRRRVPVPGESSGDLGMMTHVAQQGVAGCLL